MSLAYHVGLRRRDNAVLAQDRPQLTRLVRSVLALGRRFGLVVFGFGDHHVHLKTLADHCAARELARRLALSFGRLLGVSTGIVRSFIKPVEDGRYLYTLFRYVIQQPERHGTGIDPSCEGSALPDLLGLRPAGAYLKETVRSLLPRVDRPALLRLTGVRSLDPLASEEPLAQLVPATLAAAALPDLSGYGEEAHDARRAAAMVAGDGVGRGKLAKLLGVGRTTLHKVLRSRAPTTELVSAIRGQIALRSRYAERCAAIEKLRQERSERSVDAALRR